MSSFLPSGPRDHLGVSHRGEEGKKKRGPVNPTSADTVPTPALAQTQLRGAALGQGSSASVI